MISYSPDYVCLTSRMNRLFPQVISVPAALGHMIVFRLHPKKMELTSARTNGPVSPFCGRTQTHLAKSQ